MYLLDIPEATAARLNTIAQLSLSFILSAVGPHLMDTDLHNCLQRLHLHIYLAVLQQYDYTSWKKLARLYERDFDSLGFKLGHRRRLQREVASRKGYPWFKALPIQV